MSGLTLIKCGTDCGNVVCSEAENENISSFLWFPTLATSIACLFTAQPIFFWASIKEKTHIFNSSAQTKGLNRYVIEVGPVKQAKFI